jgi:hypothetical protein
VDSWLNGILYNVEADKVGSQMVFTSQNFLTEKAILLYNDRNILLDFLVFLFVSAVPRHRTIF